MTFEDTIARIVGETVERVLREREPALVTAVAERLGRTDSLELLTIDQAAKEVQVGAETVRSWVKQRRLRAYRTPTEPGSKRSGRIRVAKSELLRAMSPRAAVIVDADIDLQAAAIARKLGL